MNNKSLLFLLVFLLIAFPICFFLYYMSTSSSVPKIEIELVINQSNTTGKAEISKESLNELEAVLQKANIINDERKIIEIFDKERTRYIELLTIISILLTVFSLFSIVNGLVEKNSIEELKKEMNSKIDEFDIQIKDSKWFNALTSIDRKTKQYRDLNTIFHNDRNSTVDDMDGFLQNIKKFLVYCTENIAKTKIVLDENRIQQLSGYIYNFIRAANNYGINKKYFISDELDIKHNNAFKETIIHFYYYLDKSQYNLLKNSLVEIGKNELNFGDY